MVHSLGSRTSGVDGSSEGGRINTVNLPGTLVLYGVSLVQALRAKNPKTRFTAAPALVDGEWRLELTYQGDEPSAVPSTFRGHPVVLEKLEPPPAAPSA